LLEVRPGAYHDSVSLLQVSRAATEVEGVESAMVAMATPLNLDLLAGMGFDIRGLDAGPNDMVIAVRATAEGAARAREEVDRALASVGRAAGGSGAAAGAPPARTTGSAARRTDLDVALVSVPGEHAFVEAMDALRSGLHVMVFSDNVPIEQEVALKAEAARRGLLVMGPDCGTAIVGGVGLGFANVVRPGPIGLVAASGTGLQQLCCLLDDAGAGVSHALGVGGRDLSAEVGGASTLAALAALDADERTGLVVVVSKPPDAAVARRVREAAEACATPVVVAFVGRGQRDLTSVAGEALAALGRAVPTPRSWPAPERGPGPWHSVRGLFAGGTLCQEATAIVADGLGADPVMADFGDDAYTRTRPHPMIDNTLRLEGIAAEAGRGEAAVLLLDVVLGHGAHPDPASELAPALASAVAAGLATVVSLCATAGDPQDRERQAEAFVTAGASVHSSNAEAAREAVALLRGADR
jgi:FdrA protein